MPGISQYQAQVSHVDVINPQYRVVHLELLEPNQLEFAAGQYIIVDVPGIQQKRQYSICSSPEISHGLELLIDLKPGGPASQYFAQIKPGDKVNFMAPAGGFVRQDLDQPTIFIATGSGIAPIRSMIIDALQNHQSTTNLKLFWGMRSESDLFWTEDWHELDKEFDQFQIEIILSKPSSAWKLSRGYVTDLVEAEMTDLSQYQFFLCGGVNMIKTVTSQLQIKGVSQSQIKHEQFF